MATNKQRFEGKLVVIPTEAGNGIAKVVFCSSYVRDSLLLKIYQKVLPSLETARQEDFSGEYELRYTRAAPLKNGRWQVVAEEPVREDERMLTQRISGGEVWIEDRHMGPANDDDERKLLKMDIYGERLIEKFIAGANWSGK